MIQKLKFINQIVRKIKPVNTSKVILLFATTLATLMQLSSCKDENDENKTKKQGQKYQDNEFVTTWKTDNTSEHSSNETSITIPTHADYGPYNYDVDWDNDGVFEETGLTGDASHNFGTIGTYTIRIRGVFPALYFDLDNSNARLGDNLKLLTVDQWGTQRWKRLKFSGCGYFDIKASDVPDLTQVTDMSKMFLYTTSFNSPIGNWDVSHVTNMNSMFQYAYKFNQPIGDWDVSNVTDMSGMFFYAKDFNQPIGSWQVDKVEYMNFMFCNAFSFNKTIDQWHVVNVNQMIGMFRSASSFSIENYDKLLVGWSQQPVQYNVDLELETKYCSDAAATAREKLTSDFGWTITDEGRDPACQ